MSSWGSQHDDEGLNEINVVPFIDIALVLLIIFMVTTEFAREVPEDDPARLPENVPLELPKASSGEESESALLSIALNHEGNLYLNGEPSDMEAILSHVDALKEAGKLSEAFVAADERLSHGQVLRVVDALRLQGVGKVGINTKPMEID